MKKGYNLVVAALLILVFIQCVTSMANNSLLGDEPYHIASGYSKLKTGDYRLDPENGPLEPVISAIPLLFMNISFPFDHPSWEVKDMNVLMPVFLFEYNPDPYWIIFWSRIPIILLSLLLGYYIFKWANEMYGPKAGLFALLLYSFSPDILAQSQINSSDFGFAVFGTIALYYLWRFLINPDWSSLAIAGFTLGLAQLTKFSAIFLFPIYLLVFASVLLFAKPVRANANRKYRSTDETSFDFLALVKIRDSRLSPILKKSISLGISLALIFLITYGVILVGYKFEGVGIPLAESISRDIHINRDVYDIEGFYNSNPIYKFAFEKIPSPFPYYFARGLGHSFMHAGGAGAPSLVGEDTLKTEPYFFIYAFLVKTPIPLLIFLILSLFAYQRLKKYEIGSAILIITFVLYHLAFCFTTKQLGYRYMIHTVPLILVFASRVVNMRHTKNIRAILYKTGVILLLLWYLISSLLIYPHYLSYFNELIGPGNAHHYFVDSNIDWGQDLYYLMDYLDEKGIVNPYIKYYGFPETVNYPIPPLYVESYRKPGCERVEGIVAISVTYLMMNQSCYSYLHSEQPIKRIGYSIMVYNLTS